MSIQQYRGHHISVQSAGGTGDYSYTASVTSDFDGQLRHKLGSVRGGFPNCMAAEDEAFTSARAWIELHPVPYAWR